MKRALIYLSLIPVLVVAFAWLVWNSAIPHSDAADAQSECIYTVKRGDTLYDIAQRYNTTVQAFVDLNNIPNPRLIHAGNKFRIPGCTPSSSAPAPAPSGPSAPAPSPTPQASTSDKYTVDSVKTIPPLPAVIGVPAEHAATAATVQILVATRLTVAAGTGVVVGTDGRTIVTAFHLVGDLASGTPYPAIEILVGPFKGYTLRASLLEWDAANDLAVLRVEQRRDFTGFAFLPMADSDATPLNEPMHLLSYPIRPEGGVAISRGNLLAVVTETKTGQRAGFITNAVASPGSSGGVAVNERGEVLGIITRGFFVTQDMSRPDLPPVSRLTGIVPINLAKPLLDRAANK